MPYSIDTSAIEDERVKQAIIGPLGAFNAAKIGPSDYQPLVVALRDDNGVPQGGVWGYTAHGWLFIQFLVVAEALRGAGHGRALMAAAEQEALARGCHAVWLDTLEFQARGFYEKLGYELFGELPGYPPPYCRFFMKKSLSVEGL